MKLLICCLLLFLPIQWEPDFDNAKKTAAEKHELILLSFSGSDWCGPCILFRKTYLENAGFAQMANQNLILVNADFPRKKKNLGSPQQIKRNEALAETYNKQGIFPLTLLLSAQGKVLKSWQGNPEIPVEKWTAAIDSVCKANRH